jgi:hypothetical protein
MRGVVGREEEEARGVVDRDEEEARGGGGEDHRGRDGLDRGTGQYKPLWQDLFLRPVNCFEGRFYIAAGLSPN